MPVCDDRGRIVQAAPQEVEMPGRHVRELGPQRSFGGKPLADLQDRDTVPPFQMVRNQPLPGDALLAAGP